MKRRTLIPVLLLAACFCTACGSKTKQTEVSSEAEVTTPTDVTVPSLQNDDDVDARVVLDNGTVMTITDDGSIISTTDEGLEWNYLSGTCRLTFPKDWEDRFYVRGTSVYSRACYDKKVNSGKLFSIDFMEADELADSSVNYVALLGAVREFYTVAILPSEDTYDTADTDLFAEYTDMSGDLSAIFQTAQCSTTKDFKPIDLTNYELSTVSNNSKLFGCWSTKNADASGFTPYAVFRSRDSAFVFHSTANDLLFGAFYVNKNAPNYVWNTENWGDAGLVFAGGQAYRVTYSETEPMELVFEPLFPTEDYGTLEISKFFFDRDYQEIYPGDDKSSGEEVEFQK